MIDLVIDDNVYLRRRNSIHRFNLRQIEKARFPRKCHCAVCGEVFLCRGIEQYLQRQYYCGPDRDRNIRHVCWGCDLKSKVGIGSGNLFHLISAIPQAERDRYEIYPGDFRTALIPLPLQSNWGWRTFEQWYRQGVVLCGMSSESATGQDSEGLRDYSEPTRLLNKFGKYEFAYRQAGGPVWPGRDSHVALWLFGQLKTPEEQRTLKRIGCLYKNSCWWSKKEKRRLFDKCEASSWEAARLWKPGQTSFQLEPQGAVKLANKEKREIWRGAARHAPLGDAGVQYLYPPAKRHTNLANTQAAYNEQWPSYWNLGATRRESNWDFGIRSPKNGIAGVGETLRELGSLNIPHETIELRNNMVANLERDFSRTVETKAA